MRATWKSTERSSARRIPEQVDGFRESEFIRIEVRARKPDAGYRGRHTPSIAVLRQHAGQGGFLGRGLEATS